jgi:hypothetical protein
MINQTHGGKGSCRRASAVSSMIYNLRFSLIYADKDEKKIIQSKIDELPLTSTKG